MPLTCDYVFGGEIWDGRRPLCVRGLRVPGSERSTDRGRTGHGRARTGPRTGTDQPTDEPEKPRTGPMGAVIPTVRLDYFL